MQVTASPATKSKDATSPASRANPKLIPKPIPTLWLGLACGCLLLALLAAYSNHFRNGFHFDDSHSVETNPYIRSLSNIPRFFTDASTSSSLPANQNYRPLVSTTLALDYHLAGGLHPLWFHVVAAAYRPADLALSAL